MAGATLSRTRALTILRDGQAEVRELIAQLPPRAVTAAGLGSGTWSPKDLIGHLASWEAYALEALDAWERGEGVPIDKELWSKGTSRVNIEAVARKSRLSVAEMTRRADATHAELLDRIAAMSDARWRRPGTKRARTAVGERLGRILWGPPGPFRHADAHLGDLRAFVDAHPAR